MLFFALRVLTHMLIDEQYSNILPLLRKVVKGLLNN